jgi:hypothetical protein
MALPASPAARRLHLLGMHVCLPGGEHAAAGGLLRAGAAAVGAVRQSPRIAKVVAQVLRLPDVDPDKGDSGQDTLIIRVVTECGLEGYGEVEAQPEVAIQGETDRGFRGLTWTPWASS